VTGIVFFIERVTNWKMPKWAFITVFGGVFLIVSFFLAWKDQYEEATKVPILRQEVNGKSAQIAELKNRPPQVQVNVPAPSVILPPQMVRDDQGSSGYLNGNDLQIGHAYYLNGETLTLAEANSPATVPAVCVASSLTRCINNGIIVTGSWKAGGALYLSDTQPGGLMQTATFTSGHFLQVMGHAVSTNKVLVTVSPDYGGIQ
jgi:hypothetical protein